MEEWYLALIVACVVTQANAQGIDAIVNEAVNSAFGGGAGGTGGGAPPAAGFGPAGAGFMDPAGAGPAPAVGRIPTSRLSGGGVAPRPVSDRGSGASRALSRFSQSNAPATNALLNDRSMRASMASRRIAENTGGTAAAFQSAAQSPEIAASFQRAFGRYCFEIPRCNPWDPYRRTDGQCNNLDEPLLGSALTPQQRILPAAYDNFIDLPRVRSVVPFRRLPSARTVSNNILQYTMGGMTPVSSTHSMYLTHHGQFIDHDVIATPSEMAGTMQNPQSIGDCCFPNDQIKPDACFNIYVVQPDPFFPPNQYCMNFVRHAGAPPLRCENGVRQQINQRTSFVDGSAIYDSDYSSEKDLRAPDFGRLKENFQNLLPPHPRGCPAAIMTDYHCFVAGDHRPSETPTLTVPHITWLRRHNLIADALRHATGITDDETLFQEAKRIVIAQLQHVTFNEFLPGVLDDKHMNDFNLRSHPIGHAEVYNRYIDPRTINAFGVAAYRMGHSLVRNSVGHDRGFGDVREFPVSEHFERPDLMFNNGYEFMARWMSREPKSRSDRFLVDGIRNRLFESPPDPRMHPSETLSFDLGALNIQRGRDHGIPSYNAYRQFCGFYRANFFAAVKGGLDFHSPEAAAALQRTYSHVDDIDLYAGGLSETPLRGSILGPTFQCIIAYQFSLYKHGDRFWYERTFPENPVAAFNPAELAQIKQTTYSKILCSVMKNIGVPHSFQPSLMLRTNIPGNAPVPCHVLLQGSPLGFDITPFAQQLLRLGGRRGPFVLRPSPLNPGMRSIMQVRGPGLDRDMFMAPINPGRVIPTGRRRRRKLY
ncbi:peroxidase-like protein [Ostrea edulis]|uniref:peroxidase-like protein n=1 Tax=Ostrea edulis TaxID=37623 RepID=UPI0020958775|nr:peroxidase-like protein [Ostrea edulis]XP_055996608.1 peroxidase-like protein [Ostrea edulis]